MAIAGLVRTLRDGRSLTAVHGHLRHERHAIESARVVKCRDDLCERPDLDDLADAEWAIAIGGATPQGIEHVVELPSNYLSDRQLRRP